MRNAGNRKFIRVMQTLTSVKELTGEPDERKRSSPVRGGGAGKVPLNGNSPATYSTTRNMGSQFMQPQTAL